LQKALGQGAKVLGSEEYHFSFSGTMTRRSLIQHAVVRTPASISSYHPSSHWRVGPDGISAEGSIHTRSPCRAVLVHLVRAAPPGDHFPLRGRAVAAAFMGAARRAPSTRSSSPEDDASSELLSSLEEEYVGMCDWMASFPRDRMRSAMPCSVASAASTSAAPIAGAALQHRRSRLHIILGHRCFKTTHAHDRGRLEMPVVGLDGATFFCCCCCETGAPATCG
jgi:hypothetical protein